MFIDLSLVACYVGAFVATPNSSTYLHDGSLPRLSVPTDWHYCVRNAFSHWLYRATGLYCCSVDVPRSGSNHGMLFRIYLLTCKDAVLH